MSSTDYLLTIGLEVHAELKTQTKMFCASKNDPDEKHPNANICPVCMAYPGTLPVINKEAVRHILRMGIAVGGKIADYTEFDRKNYFYPDIPKGYQISQYKYPLISGGSIRGIALTRIHLEEDTARSSHTEGVSLVDYNRAGVPLMELVTEPVIHSAEDAVAFAKELQLILRTLGAGEANLEKGEMRVEANISIGQGGVLGTKVEVKNLNSFRAVERAILFEVKRQTALLSRGEKIVQETRGWDESKEETFSQRLKEDSHDYRYFPDPDLPKLALSDIPEFSRDIIAASLPELPDARRARYAALGLKEADIATIATDIDLAAFFDRAVAGQGSEFAGRVANYLVSDVLGLRAASSASGFGGLSAQALSHVIEMTFDGTLSSRGAKDTLTEIFKNGGEASEVAETLGVIQKNDGAFIDEVGKKVIADNPSVAEEYRTGKEAALQFLVGQGMKASKGSANPARLREAIISLLKN